MIRRPSAYLSCRHFKKVCFLPHPFFKMNNPKICLITNSLHLFRSLPQENMKSDNDPSPSDQSLKPRRLKSREVSSRFLSSTTTSHDNRISSSSPSQASSPIRHKTSDTRKHRSLEDSGFIRGLWPSSITSSSPSHPSSNNNNLGTLADHLGNERLRDLLEKKKDEKSSVFSISRQRSCRFEIEKEEKGSMKENHRPILGGSMRYTGKLYFSSKNSSSSSSSSSRPKSDSSMDYVDVESETSENLSGTDCNSPAAAKNPRKSGTEVSSKYMKDLKKRSKRGTSDSNIQHPVSLDSSPKVKSFTIKTAIKRANSLTGGYGSAASQWALSPGRSGSPPMSVESKERLMSFSSLKPPSSPSRSKGMEKLLNLGLDLFKGKKSSSSGSMVSGSGNVEAIHQLRLLQNRMLQWRYANIRAESVNANITKQVEKNLLSGWVNLANLRRSVLLKRLQLQKEKLEMKLDFILHSQIKQLEAWGDMERQHMTAVSETKECLHSIACRVPLIEGAKVDPQLTCIALRQASDLTASINSALTTFSLLAGKNATLLSQLAEAVSQEKLFLEECRELLQTISILEIQETSFKCHIIQSNPWLQHQQHHPQLILS